MKRWAFNATMSAVAIRKEAVETKAFIGPFLADRCQEALIDTFNGSIDGLNGRAQCR